MLRHHATPLFVALLGGLMAGSPPASAAAVVSTPLFAVVSSGLDDDHHLGHVRDQSGLQTPYVSGVTGYDAYLAGNPLHDASGPGVEWLAAPGDAAPWLLIGPPVGAGLVSGLALWNADLQPASRIDIYGSVDGFDFELLVDDQPLSAGVPGAADGAQGFAWDARPLTTLRLVLDCLPNSFCGLGEVVLRTEAAVPEPAPAALLGLAGLVGLAALGARRRRRCGPLRAAQSRPGCWLASQGT